MKGLINISNNKNYYFKWYNVSRLNPFLKTKTESQKSFLKKKKKNCQRVFWKTIMKMLNFLFLSSVIVTLKIEIVNTEKFLL